MVAVMTGQTSAEAAAASEEASARAITLDTNLEAQT